jgi:hypothetical protein
MNDSTNEPAEQGGPSETLTEQPTMIRILCGFGGLFLLTLGLATAYFAPMGRGLFSEGWGYLFTAVGCALLVFHAIRDADTEVRRVYGGLGALMLVLAVGLSIAPVKLAGMDEGVPGTLLLPWGSLAGLLAALFLVNFARHETTANLSSWVRMLLATTGGLLAVLSVALGLINPDTLPGTGSVLGMLSLVYLICFVTVTDLSTGWHRYVPLGLGVLGGLAIVYAIGKAVFPIVLFEGPTALMSAGNTSGKFPIIGRVLVILLSLSLLLALLWKSAPRWLRYSLAGTGVVFAALFLIGSFTTVGVIPPPAYFVPNGLILLFLGVAFTLTAIIVASDHPLAGLFADCVHRAVRGGLRGFRVPLVLLCGPRDGADGAGAGTRRTLRLAVAWRGHRHVCSAGDYHAMLQRREEERHTGNAIHRTGQRVARGHQQVPSGLDLLRAALCADDDLPSGDGGRGRVELRPASAAELPAGADGVRSKLHQHRAVLQQSYP